MAASPSARSYAGLPRFIPTRLIDQVLIFFIIKIIRENKKAPVWIVIISNIVGIAIGVAISLVFFSSKSDCIVNNVQIINYNANERVINGTALITENEPIHILVFAGKTGGPYWLQGASGTIYSEEERIQTGEDWKITWKISEIYVGTNVHDIRAVAATPDYCDKIIEQGIYDPASQALKFISISGFKVCNAQSVQFDPDSLNTIK